MSDQTETSEHATDKSDVNICGHCGGEVAPQFSVCRGCGANLRRDIKSFLIGSVIAMVSLVYFIEKLTNAEFQAALVGTIICAISTFSAWGGFQKRWCRKNA